AGDTGDDPEHRREAIVGAVDRTADPAAAGLVPGLAADDLLEPVLSELLARAHRRLGRRRGAVAGAEIADCHRMGTLLLADVTQERVGGGVAGRMFVETVDLLVLGRLAGGE